MLRKFTFFPALVLLALMQLAAMQSLHAQTGTANNGFLLRITIDGVPTDYANADCGYGAASFGGSILSDTCLGDGLVWAYDITPDSLACDSIAADLTGKVALIRRGVCEFGVKSLNAEKAGAVFVIIVNHYNNAADNGCTAIPIGPGAVGAQVTIPVVLVGRDIGELLAAAIQAGKTIDVCFVFPRLSDAAGPYHYATPVSQVDTLADMGVRYTNRDAVMQQDIEVKAEITEPGGNVVTLTATLDSLASGAENFFIFPPYLPPAVLGTFNVVMSTNKYTESRDTLRAQFIHTDYTFATDNFVLDPGGVGTSNINFVSGDFIHQEGAVCITGPNGGTATFATFGIANIDSVFVADAPPGSTANDVSVFIYDGDTDNDGASDLSGSFEDISQIGYGLYTMNGNEVDGNLIDVEVTDFLSGGPIELLPRHIYYVSLYYNGLEAGLGRDIRFSNSPEEWFYLNIPSTPLSIGNGTTLTFFNGGWDGADVIQRLQLQGYVPIDVSVRPTPLTDDQVKINPNPANDLVRVNLKLAAVSDVVTLTMFDWQGRAVSTQTTRNLQEGQMTVNTQSLPTGMYVLWVRTAEGTTMRKVAVSH